MIDVEDGGARIDDMEVGIAVVEVLEHSAPVGELVHFV